MRYAIGIATLMLIVPALQAQPKDIADLFPADTILYAEVNQPGVVGKDLTAYLKGSVFETSAPGFQSLRQRQDGNFNTSPSGLIAAFFAPEMLKEFAQFKGLAGGIVGFDKQGDTELLFVLLPGESKLPGFLLKAFVTARADIRKVSSVEGVDLFQKHMILYEEDPLVMPGNAPPKQKQHPIGPVYVNHPGLIVFGSNPQHVSAAIRRFKEKEKAASLTSTASFPLLVEDRAKPGILLLGDARKLLDQIDRNVKANREDDPLPWLALKNLLPPSSINTLVARLEIKDDTLRLKTRLKLNEKSISSLTELLDGAALESRDLTFSKTSPLTLTVALPNEQRAARLLGALDAVIRATGTLGPNASELLDELTIKKILSRDDLAKVRRITIAQPPITFWAKNRMPIPALMLHSDDAQTLEKIQAAIPAILELLGGTKAEPIVETINGVKICSLEAKASPMGQTIHYGRHENTLAVGIDRKALADVLRAQADANASISLKHLEGPAMVLAWNWVETIRGPAPAKKADPGPRSGVVFGPASSPYSPYYPGGMQPNKFRLTKDALDQFDGLPPLFVSLSRRGNELLLDFEQTDPKRIRTKGISHFFEWFVRVSSTWNNYGGGYRDYDGPADLQPLLPLLPPGP